MVRLPQTLELIAAALRGEQVPGPTPEMWEPVLLAAADHGVAPLLARSPAVASWDEPVRRRLREAQAAEAALALGRAAELAHLFGALDGARVPALLIKGAHLSWTHYPSPECRPHGDIDLLIDHGARAAAREALEAAGYKRLAHVTGEVAFTQVHYWRDDRAGMRHAIDLHWRVAAPRLFAGRLAWGELFAARVPLPAIHASAAGLSDVHALLLACIHRIAHHFGSERLIWLYDIDRLARGLDAERWRATVALAGERGIAALVADGLAAASRWLGTAVPDGVGETLRETPADPDVTAFAAFGGSPARIAWADFRAVPGWRDRLRFVREHVLPEPAYIAARYRTSSRAALPFLYVHRLLTGIRRWW